MYVQEAMGASHLFSDDDQPDARPDHGYGLDLLTDALLHLRVSVSTRFLQRQPSESLIIPDW